MRKLAGLFVLLVLCGVGVRAQDAPPPAETPSQDSTSQSTSSASTETTPDETKKPVKKSTLFSPKYDLSAGYSHRSFGSTGAPRIGMNGWYASLDYNWKRWLGFAGEIQGVYSTQYPLQAGVEKPSVYTALVGPQIYPFKHHKLTPFAHFLYGGAYFREPIGPYPPFSSRVLTAGAQAWELGGGLDLHIKPNWSVRAVQFDYGSTHFSVNNAAGGGSNGSTSQSSYRISVGIVYYIGKR
ncbi:MAG TPA: hypothetical protein VHX49_10330 [Candidatus Acidoferrales bacterium]|jgi:hypothetical protein|nr:hypothetical protein [Candidatus Acidoferrales bacterium]